MTLIIIIGFIVSAFLYIVNLHEINQIIGSSSKRNKWTNLLLLPYLISAILIALLRDSDRAILYSFATICFYFCLFMYLIINNSSSKIRTVYILSVFLSLDSIIQTLGCIFIDLIADHFSRDIALKMTSLLFNISVFILIQCVVKPYKNQVKDSIRLLPKKLYVLILAALILIGNLCGNMAVPNDELLFSQNINNFLIVITVLIFIAIIILFIFNSLSKNYYENISQLMEKQIEEQIRYYKKVDKLTEDLREFRHDYKNHMISLQALLECRAYEEAIEYVRDITKQELIEVYPFFSGNQLADAILNDKNEYASKNGSMICFDGFISDEIPSSDLCIILSNALDNAVEACSYIESDSVNKIKIKCAVRQNIQVIRISNPNERDSTETLKTDKENHGLGLHNIRRTVEKLNGQMHIPSKVPSFVLELEFPVQNRYTDIFQNKTSRVQ